MSAVARKPVRVDLALTHTSAAEPPLDVREAARACDSASALGGVGVVLKLLAHYARSRGLEFARRVEQASAAAMSARVDDALERSLSEVRRGRWYRAACAGAPGASASVRVAVLDAVSEELRKLECACVDNVDVRMTSPGLVTVQVRLRTGTLERVTLRVDGTLPRPR